MIGSWSRCTYPSIHFFVSRSRSVVDCARVQAFTFLLTKTLSRSRSVVWCVVWCGVVCVVCGVLWWCVVVVCVCCCVVVVRVWCVVKLGTLSLSRSLVGKRQLCTPTSTTCLSHIKQQTQPVDSSPFILTKVSAVLSYWPFCFQTPTLAQSVISDKKISQPLAHTTITTNSQSLNNPRTSTSNI